MDFAEAKRRIKDLKGFPQETIDAIDGITFVKNTEGKDASPLLDFLQSEWGQGQSGTPYGLLCLKIARQLSTYLTLRGEDSPANFWKDVFFDASGNEKIREEAIRAS